MSYLPQLPQSFHPRYAHLLCFLMQLCLSHIIFISQHFHSSLMITREILCFPSILYCSPCINYAFSASILQLLLIPAFLELPNFPQLLSPELPDLMLLCCLIPRPTFFLCPESPGTPFSCAPNPQAHHFIAIESAFSVPLISRATISLYLQYSDPWFLCNPGSPFFLYP